VVDIPDIPKRHAAFAEGHGEQRITMGEQKENILKFSKCPPWTLID
jgi:hypothetical protein